MALDQPTERVRRKLEQIGVAHRIHGRRTILVGDHGHLADDFALADLADHDLGAVGVGDGRPQSAVAHDVEALGDLALAHQHLAGVETQPVERTEQILAGIPSQGAEQATRLDRPGDVGEVDLELLHVSRCPDR